MSRNEKMKFIRLIEGSELCISVSRQQKWHRLRD
jgi:hypothetical protein